MKSGTIFYVPDGVGYVGLVDWMGDDLSPVNAAKASFARKSTALGERETRLISFLANSDPPHTSPFRHAYVGFEVKAPIFVARQW